MEYFSLDTKPFPKLYPIFLSNKLYSDTEFYSDTELYSDTKLYSETGCKRVANKVNALMD